MAPWGSAVTFVTNAPFNDKLAKLRTFGTAEFVQSVQGILDLFENGNLNALTSKIPLLNQSVDDVLGISTKLKGVVQQLQSQAGVSLKVAVQGLLSTFNSAIENGRSPSPSGSIDDLFGLFDRLKAAANDDGRTDIAAPPYLASHVVASIVPLTQIINAADGTRRRCHAAKRGAE